MSELHEFSSRKQIAAEAREWLIRLDADNAPRAAEVEALRNWIARSPAHREELQRISEFWESANVLTELAIPLLTASGAKRRAATRLRAGRRPAAWAALCLLMVASMAVLWNNNRPDPADTLAWSTQVGEQLSVDLADGSAMQLDTDSFVEVRFGTATREIRLLRGTAFFQVAPQQRPFEVHAGNGLVTAVGTAFSVDLTRENIEVIVTEGRVSIAAVNKRSPDLLNSNAPALAQAVAENLGTLESGQAASFSHAIHQISELSEREIIRQLSWREGYLVFSGEPLHEVVTEVSRYTNMKIGIAEPDLRGLRVGGRFKVGDLEEIFEVLETNFGITIDRLSSMHVELRSDQNS